MFKQFILWISITVGLLAFNLNDAISKLSCNTYSINDNMAGLYKYFDATDKLWFLYMPSLNYLLIHETGKAKTTEGATIISTSDFSSLGSQSEISFGQYNGTNSRASKLSNKTFRLDEPMTGIYKYFDTTNHLWFLYMPSLNYLLIHETGKTKTTEGAQIVPVSNYFQSIEVIKDPFGNSTGSIKFIPIAGCSGSTSSGSGSSSSESYYHLTDVSGVHASIDINNSIEADDLYFCPNHNFKVNGTDEDGEFTDYGTWSIVDGKIVINDPDGTSTITLYDAPQVHATGSIVSNDGTDTFTITSLVSGVTNDVCENNSSSSSSSASSSEGSSSSSGLEMPPTPPDLNSSSSSGGVDMPPSPPQI